MGFSSGLVIALAAALSACAGKVAPALLADDVIHTAEAAAEMTRQAVTPTPSATVQPPAATLVPATPTVGATPTPVVTGPVVTANYPVKVRNGPGEEYDEVDLFLAGQMAQVVGRYDNTPIGTWYLLKRIDVGKDGWVWSGAVALVGDPTTIPVLELPK